MNLNVSILYFLVLEILSLYVLCKCITLLRKYCFINIYVDYKDSVDHLNELKMLCVLLYLCTFCFVNIKMFYMHFHIL